MTASSPPYTHTHVHKYAHTQTPLYTYAHTHSDTNIYTRALTHMHTLGVYAELFLDWNTNCIITTVTIPCNSSPVV